MYMYVCIHLCMCVFVSFKWENTDPTNFFQTKESPPGTRVGKSGQEQTGLHPCPEIVSLQPQSQRKKKYSRAAGLEMQHCYRIKGK